MKITLQLDVLNESANVYDIAEMLECIADEMHGGATRGEGVICGAENGEVRASWHLTGLD